jgi:hypothetical protein
LCHTNTHTHTQIHLDMKKVLLTAFIAGLSFLAIDASAQSGTYRDEQGEYRYETREERVWIPEQRTGGIFGVGGRTIPGHYETRTNQVKVYYDQNGNPINRDRQYGEGRKGWEGKHPHGMPPGQRKKMQGNSGNYERNRGSDRNNDGVIDERDRNYDRNNDGVIDDRDRGYDRDNDRVTRDREYRDDDDRKGNRGNKNNKGSKPNKNGKSKN